MAAPPIESLARLTYEDVVAMDEAGILEGRRVELEAGLLIEIPMPQGEEHSLQIERLHLHFAVAAQGSYRVRSQTTFRIPDGGFYEPDLFVFAPETKGQPRAAWLAVEIAVTSHARDRHKAAIYALADVGEYWIVDVPRREVVVHADPQPEGYASVRRYVPGDQIVPPVPAPPVDVAALLAD